MRRFITNYVQGCAKCQQYKINRRPTKPAFQPIEGAKSDRPFANCSMDMITDLPPSEGFDSMLSIIDHGLSKGAYSSHARRQSPMRGSPTIDRPSLQEIWTTRQHYIRQRTAICSKSIPRNAQDVRSQVKPNHRIQTPK